MTQLHVRRATVEDLNALRAIWHSMRLPADELEKRLKEFQVVESGGQIAGAIGVQFLEQNALLYGEGFADFAVADAARQLFWNRIQTLATNHGVFRIWTQEDSPFWLRWGFLPVSEKVLSRLPEPWKSPGGKWFTLELKNEEAIAAALQTKFAGFLDAEKKQTARLTEKAKTLKATITVVCFLIFLVCVAILIYWAMQGAS